MLTRNAGERRVDSGFTLVELIVSIGLLGIIFSTLSLVIVGSIRVNAETRDRLDATRDEQFVAAYLASDMAGASQVVAGGASQCGTGTPVVTIVGKSFVPTASTTAAPGPTTTVASYVFSTATVDGVLTGSLTRRYCEGSGAPPFVTPSETSVVASRLKPVAPVPTCSPAPPAPAPACSTTTTTLSVVFDRLDGGQFTLSATRRATP